MAGFSLHEAGVMAAGLAVQLNLLLRTELSGIILTLRTLGALAVLLLLGLVLPTGLGLLRGHNRQAPAAWAWGVNGIASVLGASLGLWISIAYGLFAALWLVALCYLVAGLAGLGLLKAFETALYRPT